MHEPVKVDSRNHAFKDDDAVSHANWKALNPRKQSQLVALLEKQDLNQTQIRKKLCWAKDTTKQYIEYALKMGWITEKQVGRQIIYRLVQSSSDVAKMLKWKSPIAREHALIKIEGTDRIDSEEKFIKEWMRVIRLESLDILQDFSMDISKRRRKRRIQKDKAVHRDAFSRLG